MRRGSDHASGGRPPGLHPRSASRCSAQIVLDDLYLRVIGFNLGKYPVVPNGQALQIRLKRPPRQLLLSGIRGISLARSARGQPRGWRTCGAAPAAGRVGVAAQNQALIVEHELVDGRPAQLRAPEGRAKDERDIEIGAPPPPTR